MCGCHQFCFFLLAQQWKKRQTNYTYNFNYNCSMEHLLSCCTYSPISPKFRNLAALTYRFDGGAWLHEWLVLIGHEGVARVVYQNLSHECATSKLQAKPSYNVFV